MTHLCGDGLGRVTPLGYEGGVRFGQVDVYVGGELGDICITYTKQLTNSLQLRCLH